MILFFILVSYQIQQQNTSLINPGSKGLKPFTESDVQVEIYNSLGELVMSDVQHLIDVGHLIRIDISHLPVGLYFVKIGNWFEKFVKI